MVVLRKQGFDFIVEARDRLTGEIVSRGLAVRGDCVFGARTGRPGRLRLWRTYWIRSLWSLTFGACAWAGEVTQLFEM